MASLSHYEHITKDCCCVNIVTSDVQGGPRVGHFYMVCAQNLYMNSFISWSGNKNCVFTCFVFLKPFLPLSVTPSTQLLSHRPEN